MNTCFLFLTLLALVALSFYLPCKWNIHSAAYFSGTVPVQSALECKIGSILLVGLVWTIYNAFLAVWIEHRVQKSLERIEKQLEKKSVPVGYTEYTKIEEV